MILHHISTSGVAHARDRHDGPGAAHGEGSWRGDGAAACLHPPRSPSSLKRSPLQGKLLRKRIQTWSEQLGEEMRHKPVPVALEREYLLYQAHRQLPLPELVGRLPALLEALSSTAPLRGCPQPGAPDGVAQPTEAAPALHREGRASLVGSLLQLQQQIAEAEREKQRQEIEDQLLANRTLADALIRTRSPPGLWDLAQGSWHKRSLALVKQYARMLQQEPLLAEIAALLGRSEREWRSEDRTLPPVPVHELEEVQSDDVPDDLVGAPGQRSDAPPAERGGDAGAAGAGTGVLSPLSGAAPAELPVAGHPAAPASDAALPEQGGQEVQPRGPFIVCVDTSGSMGAIRRSVPRRCFSPCSRGDGGEAGLLSDALLHRGGDPGDHRRHRA